MMDGAGAQHPLHFSASRASKHDGGLPRRRLWGSGLDDSVAAAANLFLFIYLLFVCLFIFPLSRACVSVKPAQRMNNSLLPPPSSLRVRVISSHPPHRTPTPAGPARPPPNTAPTPAANSYGTAMRWDGSQSICTATPTSFRFGWPALAVQQNIWLTRFRPALSSGGGEFREGGGGGGALSWRRPTSPPVKETLAGVDPLLEGRG